MSDMPTVEVIALHDNYEGALLLKWKAKPHSKEVRQVFRQIKTYLNNASSPVHIVVDIREKPRFPLAETLNGALQPQTHKNMGTWIVIGTSAIAKFIARSISTFGQRNIEWYENESEAYTRLQDLLVEQETTQTIAQ